MASTCNAPLVPSAAPAYSTVLCSGIEQMQRAMAIRHKVFCEEQGYDPAIEVDELDALCDHLLMTRKNADGTEEDVGTLRWYPPKGKVGRVAVHRHFRGTGAGSTLCLALEEHVRERRGKAADVTRGKTTFDLVAHSQKIAEVFYHRLGWETVGEDFVEEGQPHCKVVKTIQLNPEPAIASLNGSKPPTRSYAVRWCETQADIDRCIQIRIAVFVDEQGFSMEDELDEKDPASDHFLMTTVVEHGEEEDVGTIRWWPKSGVAAGKIGRVCVLPKYRGGGTGRLLMTSIEEHVRNRRGKAGEAVKGKASVTAIVHSQMHAEGFYSKAGYVREGDKFMEDGAFHCKLVKEIQLVPETGATKF